ncbi:rho GTPase-activating protein gacII-like [Solea solea]|uniref:rho GTPase-activating protein gacII-like n=1 Tax=Solea solea TaxID=90069 RepID=UPI00272D0FAE|nr:rho GTPase-activating protein gacII-like [Solea solea]
MILLLMIFFLINYHVAECHDRSSDSDSDEDRTSSSQSSSESDSYERWHHNPSWIDLPFWHLFPGLFPPPPPAPVPPPPPPPPKPKTTTTTTTTTTTKTTPTTFAPTTEPRGDRG